jgi:hypothetical protein
MDEYVIGAGALLTAGPAASIAGATLHAQTEAGLAVQVKAAVIDFEAVRLGDASHVLIVAAGWSGARFRAEVVSRLLSQRECGLADVMTILAEATGAEDIHVFAHWLADDESVAGLAQHGIRVICHPIEAIGQAALVCGQRVGRWPVQAAPRVATHDAA